MVTASVRLFISDVFGSLPSVDEHLCRTSVGRSRKSLAHATNLGAGLQFVRYPGAIEPVFINDYSHNRLHARPSSLVLMASSAFIAVVVGSGINDALHQNVIVNDPCCMSLSPSLPKNRFAQEG